MGTVVKLVQPVGNERSGFCELGRLCDTYIQNADLAVTTRRSYGFTLEALRDHFGADHNIAALGRNRLKAFLDARYGESSTATYNRAVAVLKSLFAWAVTEELIDTSPASMLKAKKVRQKSADARSADVLDYDFLESLWSNRKFHVRDRTLWVMLYETGARANEILAMNLADVHQRTNHGEVVGKGGTARTVAWGSATARRLHDIINGRTNPECPLFLTHRKPRQGYEPAATDLCPETGNARLGYDSALRLFKQASNGKTLHQLRHARLTHLAENGETTPALRAISGHTSLHSLQRYINPTNQTVRDIAARNDPRSKRSR